MLIVVAEIYYYYQNYAVNNQTAERRWGVWVETDNKFVDVCLYPSHSVSF
jgi:hypothetical protein